MFDEVMHEWLRQEIVANMSVRQNPDNDATLGGF